MRCVTSLLAAGLAGVALSSAAVAGPGTSFSFTSPNINASTSWANSGNLAASNAIPAATYVSARITATIASGGTALQSAFALASQGATGSSLTPTLTGATAVYYNASGQAFAVPNNFSPLWLNNPLSTSYAGGTNPLFLSLRNSGGSSSFQSINVTLFQAATADFSGSITSSNPTFLRPGSFSGSGSPSTGTTQQTYAVHSFQVSTTGSYYVSMLNNASGGFYGLLYSGGFDPLSPTTNLVRSTTTTWGSSTNPSVGGVNRVNLGLTSNGADFQTAGVPGITLTAGVDYYYVVAGTSFSSTNPTTGSYQIFFEGPGSIVPAPGAMGVLGMGGLLAARRRRR